VGRQAKGLRTLSQAPLAYSYLRFSTPEQASGDSRRRQLMLAEQFAGRHGLALDRDLSFRDLGVSAFHGRNAREGGLRAFLDAIELGLVPKGSHLLVESLDRLSRDRVLAAQGLFLQIIQAGVTIVTLVDQRTYSIDSLDRNPTDLIVSLVTMMRANEESATKSLRNRAAWANKRTNLAETPMTGRCPGWLRLNPVKDRFEVIEERADVVRRVYREALAGKSQHAITRALNLEKVPLFGHGNQRGKMWHRPFVAHLLSTPAVVGTLVPRVTEHADGRLRLHPQDPVLGYYPPIIDEDAWHEMRHRHEANRAHNAQHGPPRRVACLLGHLAKCPCCGNAMILTNSGENWQYLVCGRAYASAGCTRRSARYAEIELLLTRDIKLLIDACPPLQVSEEVRRRRLTSIAARLRALRLRRDALDEATPALRLMRTGTVTPLAALKAEKNALLAERRALKARVPRWQDAIVQARLDTLSAAAASPVMVPAKLNAALRALLTRVVVDWERNCLTLHWKHGGESNVPYDPDALRQRRRSRSRQAVRAT